MSGQRKKKAPAQNRPQPKTTTPVADPVASDASASQASSGSTQELTSSRGSVKGSRQTARSKYEKNKREMQMIKIGSGILAAVLVIAAAFGVYNWAQDRDLNQAPEGEVTSYTYVGNSHTESPVVYDQTPPVGGAHDSVWYTCQYYDTAIRTENAVHSLEHGAIWITFDPNLPNDQKNAIKNIADEQGYILASPMEGLPAPVVASSWNHQILLQDANDDDLKRFIATYKQGPDTPEPGASCSGITNPEGV
ncbi:MAG: DUF3105 domain-containing protein [Thermomicrobiales bacterium]